MKKFFAIVLVLCFALMSVGCGVKGWKDSGNDDTSSKEESLVKTVDDKDYENNLAGLAEYLKAAEVIKGDATKMSAEMIGAVSGEKYSYDKNTFVEIYEFDTANLSADAKEVLDSVKEKGSFVVLGTEVEATISENGKYIMVYTQAKENEELKKASIEAFKVFKKG